jgi:methylenetetrahydrofolate reductase (NADPH)
MACVTTTVEGRADPIEAIADFMSGFSLEATRPSADDVVALADIVPAGASVYVSAVPSRPVHEAIDAAARLRRAGFEPVPHLAVRGFATARELDDFLSRVSGEAGVARVLVIAGDHDGPAGDFRSAIEVIDGGALQRHGITGIAIAAYPDGHPRISQQDLDRSLADKIQSAETTGLAVHIITQFCFNAQAILQWIARLRDFGVEHPVRVGLARRLGARAVPSAPRRAGPRRWRSAGSRSRRAMGSGSSRRQQAADAHKPLSALEKNQ